MMRGKRATLSAWRSLLLVCVCALPLVGCVKEGTSAFLDATTSAENEPKLDVLRERTAVAVNEWTRAAVNGALDAWADPQRQAVFRQQTALLAHQLAQQAVDGLLDSAFDGITEPQRVEQLKAQLSAALDQGLVRLSHDLTTSISPAIDQTLHAASQTLASDLRQQLGPALTRVVHDQLMPSLADGLRKDIGPALADVIKDDIAAPLEKDVGASLGAVVGKSLEAPLGRVLDRLEQLSDKARDDAVETAQRLTKLVAASLGSLLIFCALGGIFAWRKARAQLRTVELLAKTIKRLEAEPGVQRLLGELRESSIGTNEGNDLNRFLDARPSLRAHLASSA